MQHSWAVGDMTMCEDIWNWSCPQTNSIYTYVWYFWGKNGEGYESHVNTSHRYSYPRWRSGRRWASSCRRARTPWPCSSDWCRGSPRSTRTLLKSNKTVFVWFPYLYPLTHVWFKYLWSTAQTCWVLYRRALERMQLPQTKISVCLELIHKQEWALFFCISYFCWLCSSVMSWLSSVCTYFWAPSDIWILYHAWGKK